MRLCFFFVQEVEEEAAPELEAKNMIEESHISDIEVSGCAQCYKY